MFSKALLVAFTSASLVVATKTVTAGPPKATSEPISQCNTGDAQCCNQAASADSAAAKSVLKLLDVVVSGVNVLVGLTCTPITVVGGSGTCNQQPLCCENNEFNGLINIGCTPITL